MIVDCFPFHQELELLEIRLNVLGELVDQFVIVEDSVTFTGRPKPYLLERALRDGLIEGWNRNIHYKTINTDYGHLEPFGREFMTRDMLGVVAQPYIDDDTLVLFGDLDEIPHPDTVAWIAEHRNSFPLRMQQHNHYFWLNARAPGLWDGTVVANGKDTRQLPWHRLRNETRIKVHKGGWHFGWCMRQQQIANKTESFSHTEMDSDASRANLLGFRSHLRDVADNQLSAVEIDDSYPAYIREHQHEYRHLIWQA